MKKTAIFAFAIFFGLSGLVPLDAYANNGKGHGRGGPEHERVHEHGHAKIKKAPHHHEYLIGISNREAIKRYLRKHHGHKCPPGLAKKNNGCLPPGHAKKYAVGQHVPNGVLLHSLPDELLKLLYPPHYGQKYVRVDNDILLVDQASRTVIDAVTLLSAINGN